MLRKRVRSESPGEFSQYAKRARVPASAVHIDSARKSQTERSRSAECKSTSLSPSLPSVTRGRSLSVGSDHRPVQLTKENLASFEAAHSSTMPSQRTASPSRNASGANIDDKQKLDAYNIRFDVGAILPAELNTFVDAVVRRARDGPASPNAQRTVERRRRAALQNEATGIATLEKSLLFEGQAGDEENGVPLLEKKANVNLSRCY
ncbi:uncharacterized protein ALTATR162_LOCUS5013 [Alternaria atra]|uniref:Uncharacterized protein n=1 Tax=Alternaria atra TaxID=119953 RepID=A0A8J2N5N1_9PLEO|nr:uncharacterized protein ALTATR162_LOCUS5013 [Alternaria atra]CAG5158157.1 unnamed protein product [Alternaria atra]